MNSDKRITNAIKVMVLLVAEIVGFILSNITLVRESYRTILFVAQAAFALAISLAIWYVLSTKDWIARIIVTILVLPALFFVLDNARRM